MTARTTGKTEDNEEEICFCLFGGNGSVHAGRLQRETLQMHHPTGRPAPRYSTRTSWQPQELLRAGQRVDGLRQHWRPPLQELRRGRIVQPSAASVPKRDSMPPTGGTAIAQLSLLYAILCWGECPPQQKSLCQSLNLVAGHSRGGKATLNPPPRGFTFHLSPFTFHFNPSFLRLAIDY